jgi:hypothetical protein
MSRRFPAVAAFVVAFVLAACNSTPAAPALTDPNEILTKSLTAMGDVKSFHLEMAVSGTINADLMGTGSPASITLDATSADADVDVANRRAQANFVLTAPFTITGELIQIGDTSYTKVSAMGDKYTKSENAPDDLPVDADPAEALAKLGEFLDRPEIAPIKADDAKCGDKDCYVVEIDLTAAEIAAMAGSLPEQLDALGDGEFKLEISVQKDTLRLGRLLVGLAGGDMGSLQLTVDFSRYDEAVTIEAPPADQVE